MTGLRIPEDLDAWTRWRGRRTLVRSVRNRFRPASAPPRLAWVNSIEPPHVAVGIAAATASGRAAMVAPLKHLQATPSIAFAEQEIGHLLPGWRRLGSDRWDVPRSVGVVLADGHYLSLGHDLWEAAQRRGIPYLAVQHGLVTPLAPPLAPGSTLLAWTEEDGRFWRSGRTDIAVEAVGSQLLWEAAVSQVAPRDGASTAQHLTYLGQGHAAEIARGRLVHAALTFCRDHSATYRPHPSEHDLASRVALDGFSRVGIEIDRSGVPLPELESPVVSVFSTGVLEAAARGLHAYVDFPRPPYWLREFWERYGMNRYGSTPTAAPEQPRTEPAKAIARLLELSL